MSASYDTLLRLAALTRSALEDDLRELDRRLDALNDADITLLFFALTALKGRAFKLTTNTPERYREFVEHVGATLEKVESERPGSRWFIFRPPAAQWTLHIKPHEGRAFCAEYRLFVQAIGDRRLADD